MFALILVGLVSGLVTAISPCVQRVRPAILTSPFQCGAADKRCPYVVVGGLVVSFAVFTLIGELLISSLGLPDDVLRRAGILTLSLVGLSLVIPAVGHLLEKPFINTKIPTLKRDGNGFVMGLALRLVSAPAPDRSSRPLRCWRPADPQAHQGEFDSLAGHEEAQAASGDALTFDQCEQGDATVLQNCGPARALPDSLG